MQRAARAERARERPGARVARRALGARATLPRRRRRDGGRDRSRARRARGARRPPRPSPPRRGARAGSRRRPGSRPAVDRRPPGRRRVRRHVAARRGAASGRGGRRPRAAREPHAGRGSGGGRPRRGPRRAPPERCGVTGAGGSAARARERGARRPPGPPQAPGRSGTLRRHARGGAPAGGLVRRTILGGAPIAAGLVALFLFLLFPIDTVVRALLARATPAGEGTVEVHAGEWRSSAGPLVAVGTLHAERASFGWRLVGDRVALTSFELHGPDLSAEGEGTVRLAAPLEASGLELRLAVAAAPEAPDRVRALLGLLPAPAGDAAGPRRLFVAGTVASPRLLAP